VQLRLWRFDAGRVHARSYRDIRAGIVTGGADDECPASCRRM
jgi:hypothetical protein